MRRTRRKFGEVLVIAIATGAAATAAHAVDGVRLIGKRTVYPIVINAPGSYRLRSNITDTDPNTTVISITAEDVTLDLNGFTIGGPVTCDPDSHVCSASGTGVGVHATVERGVVVRSCAVITAG